MLQPGFFEGSGNLAESRPLEQWSQKLVIRNLLCAVDFTEFSYQAVRYASGIARHFGSHLFIQHIVAVPSETSWNTEPFGLAKERLRGARRIAHSTPSSCGTGWKKRLGCCPRTTGFSSRRTI